MKTFDNSKRGIDLQLFAELTPEQEAELIKIFEGNPEGGAEEEPGYVEPKEQPPVTPEEAAMDELQNKEGQPVADQQAEGEQPPAEQPPVEGEQPTEQATEGQPEQQAPTDEKLLGKFSSVDDLVNAYQNLESFNTQTRQELAQTKELANQLQGMIQQLQETRDANRDPSQAGPTPEELEAEKEEFLNAFYDNPKEAFRQVVSEMLDNEITPIKQKIEEDEKQREWFARVDDFANEHPDIDDWKEDMGRFLMEHQELRDNPNALDIAYNAVRGQKYKEPNPQEYLQDDKFVEENILNNDDIKNKIIQQYLSDVQKGEKAPATISNQDAAGKVPVTPPKKPKDWDDAYSMALDMFK